MESEEEMSFRMVQTGKPLADLQAEVEREQCVYPSTNHDVFVTYVPDYYLFYRFDEGHGGTAPEHEPDPVTCRRSRPVQDNHPGETPLIAYTHEYETFEDLLADWPKLAALPVWSTAESAERRAWWKRLNEPKKRGWWLFGRSNE